MGFRQGAYATVWEIKDKGENSTKIRISTSKKNKQTDEYETDFSGFARLVAGAHKNASALSDKLFDSGRCRIKIGACDVTSRYDKDAGREYINFTIFDFEFPGQADTQEGAASSSAEKASAPAEKKAAKKSALAEPAEEEDSPTEDDDEDLPF